MSVLRLRALARAMLLGVVLVSLTAATAFAQDETESIQKFVGRKDQWSALIGATFAVEGHVGVIGPQRLQFEGCDLPFELGRDLPVLPRDTRVAEVTGGLTRTDGRLVFRVTAIRKRETDLETLRSRRSRIETNKPEAWFTLADWALSRGEFYQDSELKNKAGELREIGLTAESRRLRADDADGLVALAKRASQWGLDETLGWRFTHDACRIELTKARRDPNGDPTSVLGRVLKSLPGSDTPLVPADEPLRQAYEKNAAESYAKADTDVRRKLHRALYIEILLARIERDALTDGKNGYAIAARISQQIPELGKLAESYREKEIAFLKGRVAALSRNELVDFAAKLVDRKQPEDATQVKKDWLRSHEPGARAAGPRGLMQLADDYVLLMNDEKTATVLYESAWVANPQAPEPAAWLTAKGLVQDGSRWVRKVEGAKPETDRFAQAIQEGQVLAGMTSEQARAAMGAKPSSIVRQASRGKVSELWIYRTEGLVVSLLRNTGEASAHVDNVAALADEVP